MGPQERIGDKVGPMSRRLLAQTVVYASLLASCGGFTPTIGGLPTHKDLDGYPTALLEASLVRNGDCVYAP